MRPVVLVDFRLPTHSVVIFSPLVTHHIPELFHEPELFRPERWMRMNPSPYAYLPFGAGPRHCLGGPLAMMTFKVALPMILSRYRLSCVPDSEICGLVRSTMLSPTMPLWLAIDQHDGTLESHPIRGNIHDLVTLPPPTRVSAAGLS
jgi:cytochrome P450